MNDSSGHRLGWGATHPASRSWVSLPIFCVQKKGRAEGAGSHPKDRAATYLQELCSTGPGLRVLIEGRLQEVAELHRPGGVGTGGGSQLRVGQKLRKFPSHRLCSPGSHVLPRHSPQKTKGAFMSKSSEGDRAFEMTFSS